MRLFGAIIAGLALGLAATAQGQEECPFTEYVLASVESIAVGSGPSPGEEPRAYLAIAGRDAEGEFRSFLIELPIETTSANGQTTVRGCEENARAVIANPRKFDLRINILPPPACFGPEVRLGQDNFICTLLRESRRRHHYDY